jgi:hypothetical protein
MIIPIIIFALYISSVTAGEELCGLCLYNGQQFSCGAIVLFSGRYQSCCNGRWCTCGAEYPNRACGCICTSSIEQSTIKNNKIIVNGDILDDNYFLTKEGHLYTEYVTLAQKTSNGDTYIVGQTIHSSKLKQNDMILWPGFDIDPLLSKMDNVAVKIENYNVSADNYKCCPRMRHGIDCTTVGCCGIMCCC